MNLIAAVYSNWAIGNKGGLLVSIPKDQKTFRDMTMGKVVVYGRKTLDTFPQKQPLQGRTNIMLSHKTDYAVRGAVVVNSKEQLLEELKKYNYDDIYIIGGESVYEQMLPYCRVAHITKIDHVYEADAHFPNLDKLPEWKVTEESDDEVYFDLEYVFQKYEKIG